jgi:acetolactate synthase I/II/III large subunit
VNGAQALIRTLVASGVEVCFTNPGTSEMHFVAALDDVPDMRGVLALFEGVATGAADGYGRMAGRPAATLLHLGPGLGNGLANLHNARRAHTPIVNIVGDHALTHQRYDAQLQSDIETVARNVSSWIRSSASVDEVAGDAAAAVAAALAPPGSVATLILPADVSWSEGAEVAPPREPPPATAPDPSRVDVAATALRTGEPAALFVGGRAVRGQALDDAARIAAGTGAKLLAETFPARLERGAGRPVVERLSYLGEFASMQLAGLRHLIVVDAPSPVTFFAYPDRPGDLVPEGCRVTVLAAGDDDVPAALAALAVAVDAPDRPPVQEATRPARPTGPLTADTVAQALGALLPDDAIVSDEANTSGLFAPGHTAGAPPHDWLTLTGGAIGQGLPVALGAAIACPDRPVVALQADGSALYTVQALWTMAREELDVTVVVFNNRAYSVLNMELDRVGGGEPGPRARALFDLSDPPLDFVTLAAGLGVPASRADTAEAFTTQLERALAAPGPRLVEAIVPPIM